MADITMCLNTLCPNAGHCRRVTATPNELFQSVAMFEYKIGRSGAECEHYMPEYKYSVSNNTK